MCQQVINLTKMQVPSLASLSGLRIQCCREQWRRPSAVTQIRPPAWELPCATGVALKKKKKKVKISQKLPNYNHHQTIYIIKHVSDK